MSDFIVFIIPTSCSDAATALPPLGRGRASISSSPYVPSFFAPPPPLQSPAPHHIPTYATSPFVPRCPMKPGGSARRGSLLYTGTPVQVHPLTVEPPPPPLHLRLFSVTTLFASPAPPPPSSATSASASAVRVTLLVPGPSRLSRRHLPSSLRCAVAAAPSQHAFWRLPLFHALLGLKSWAGWALLGLRVFWAFLWLGSVAFLLLGPYGLPYSVIHH